MTAFEPDHINSSETIANSHLSVNSTEVESLDQIADYHRLNWQDGKGKAALCVHTVFEYCDVARKSAVAVEHNSEGIWEFRDYDGKAAEAYRHRPVMPAAKNPLGSKSHCGVEFVRALDEYRATQFARRLSSKGRFHLF
ncbi:hypothetical protein [Bradyrhizobium sp.]|uniref:hypothetical protein n=1 Tax=Bradyrhizobium sp. TaxID=376 RepID=UPI002DDD712B|nr:hypothetical protein [Bradyrhizobium sp.]HEV2156362.1 hypothetical protein [Bradyrhizobium sp.]